MAQKYAVTHTTTGAVLKWGFTDFSSDYDPATETITNINNGAIPVAGIPLYYNKLVSAAPKYNFTEMDQAEKDAVDAAGLANPVTSGDVQDFVDANAEVLDTATGLSGTFDIMQLLSNRRELHNDEDNPLYIASGFTPILGAGGWGTDHANRINNLEAIVGKNGWLRQEITRALYNGPSNVLIYYGWLNSFNSANNGWDNEKVAQDMARYDILVFGDGIQDSGHGDYANTAVIIPRIKALNPSVKIFGYVATTETTANFEDKVDAWETLQVHGIFMDEAGYDYGTDRDDFNDRVDYVHEQTYANLCFVNAWNMDHIIGTTNDTSYPNSTWNPSLNASNLTYDDWYLLESFAINTSAYSGNGGYETASNWLARGVKAFGHRSTYGINLASIGIINNANSAGQALFEFGFVSALMFSLEAWGSSDTYYGASSAAVTRWERPEIGRLANLWSLSPTVIVDTNDSDVYWRFVKHGRLKLDFSSSAQLSAIAHESRRYPNSATDPVTNLAKAGDRYFNTALGMEMLYDGTRDKWLSVNGRVVHLGRDGSVAAGAYFNTTDGLTTSATRGIIAWHNGTITRISYTRDDTDSATFEVTADGSAVAELASSATSGYSNAIDGDFSQGDILAIRNKSGSNSVSYVVVEFEIKWRV